MVLHGGGLKTRLWDQTILKINPYAPIDGERGDGEGVTEQGWQYWTPKQQDDYMFEDCFAEIRKTYFTETVGETKQ